ncbi:MAG: hypothetical protein CM15mP98_04210 [Paracoccaceae bacterium]|nr:MAG: hypothetical protein CM15mP98_04210 [Paracoccaceae bacterium]
MRRTVTKFWLENSTSMYYIYIGLINLLSVLKGRLLMVDVTDQISHEHEKKNFFTRWFMSTNHKDIGILYIFTAALLGFVAVAFTVYMRLELMEPGVQYMTNADGEPNGHMWNVLITGHGVLMMFLSLFQRFSVVLELFHALNDWCSRHGISKNE